MICETVQNYKAINWIRTSPKLMRDFRTIGKSCNCETESYFRCTVHRLSQCSIPLHRMTFSIVTRFRKYLHPQYLMSVLRGVLLSRYHRGSGAPHGWLLSGPMGLGAPSRDKCFFYSCSFHPMWLSPGCRLSPHQHSHSSHSRTNKLEREYESDLHFLCLIK